MNNAVNIIRTDMVLCTMNLMFMLTSRLYIICEMTCSEEYAENAPEDLQELTDEREGLRLLWTYWRSEHDSISPRETTEDERRLMYIGGQSL